VNHVPLSHSMYISSPFEQRCHCANVLIATMSGHHECCEVTLIFGIYIGSPLEQSCHDVTLICDTMSAVSTTPSPSTARRFGSAFDRSRSLTIALATVNGGTALSPSSSPQNSAMSSCLFKISHARTRGGGGSWYLPNERFQPNFVSLSENNVRQVNN
jgi:hypothetical protein